MRTYLIAYDLAHPHRNKHVLAQEIMSLGQSWARPLESTWYVRSEEGEEAIESRLRDLLDDEDGLVIQGVKREAALTNTALRWFRQRRAGFEAPEGSNIIVFPAPPAPETDEPELPFAKAG